MQFVQAVRGLQQQQKQQQQQGEIRPVQGADVSVIPAGIHCAPWAAADPL